MKFKEGDKVVPTRNDLSGGSSDAIGRPFTIESVQFDYSKKPWYKLTSTPYGYEFYEEELELESVYNSPLYKALK